MDPFFSPEIKSWFEFGLMWVGFGTCVGLFAKALMPGRDPGGTIATLLMGITGVIIGCGVYTLVYDEKISPITSVGMICRPLGAFVLLFFYRMLGGVLLDEAGSLGRRPAGRDLGQVHEPVRRRRRRRHSYFLEE